MGRSRILLLAHGARDPDWARALREIRDRVAADRPHGEVVLAFLEHMQPVLGEAIDDAVAQGAGRLLGVPLFLHLKRDVPALLARARRDHPALDRVLVPAIGEVPEVVEAIAAWVARLAPPGA